MTKKKVTAPLTYNPGKGRPKEHLAYLNYQEMQALKRLNGNNQERGPRGLPSFPPAGAMSGGSAKSPASTSRSAGAGSRPSSGGRDGGIRDSVGANRPSSSGASRGDVGGRDSGTRGGVGSNRPSSSGASRGDVAGRDGGTRNVAGANTPDKSSINSVNRTNTLGAQKSPAFKADTGRTVNVGPMGTPVNVKAPPGGKIKGAIQGVKTPQATQTVTRGVSVPTATMTTQQMSNLYSQYQQPPSPPPKPEQIAEKLRQAYPDTWGKYSVDEVQRAVGTLAGALPGEADVNKYSAGSMRNLAQVGINQVNRGIAPEGMLKAIDTTGLDIERGTQGFAMPGPKSMGMTGNWADQNLARQSYETALRSIESAAENKGVSPTARNATNFVAEGTPMVKGVNSVGSPVYGTQFGVDPTGRAAVEKQNRLADARRSSSDLNIVPTSETIKGQYVPTPRSRPSSQNMQRPPSAGRSTVNPTLREKEINDRLVNFQSPDGTRTTVSVGNVYDSLVGSGVPEGDASRIANEMITAPGNEYNIKSPPPGRPNERTLDAGLGRNPYDVQRAIGVPRARPPQPGLGRAAYDIERSPTQYSGIDSFTPPQVTAGLSRNPFDTQTTGKYSGYGSFTPPVRTANLDRNVYDVGRAPSTYSGITGFNVPNSTADITRNQFDTRLSAPKYSGYGATGYSTLSGIPTPDSTGLTGEGESPSLDTSTTKISVGSNLGTIDKIVEDQKNLTKQEKDELKRILSDAAAADTVEWSTNNFNATVNEAKKNVASGESPSSPNAQPAPKGGYPLTSMGTAPVVKMPQISLNPEQREIVEERVGRGQTALEGTGAGLSVAFGVPGGRKLGGYLGEKYEESVKKKLDNYVLATPEQRAEMERKDPSLTAWAGIIGETPQLDRSNYTNWADKSGLRGPPDRRGGGENSGIASLGTRPRGDETTTPRPETPSTTPGRRPDIHYMWDLGINIPSPSDPNYNQYQTYLAERLAAQRAMGYA